MIEPMEEGNDRWLVERNTRNYFKAWMKEISEALPGDLIPLQWVPEYVGVSRAAVYKRAKAGGMSVFSFIVTEWVKGKDKQRDTRTQYDFAVRSECDAWREILWERSGMVQDILGQEVTLDEIEERLRERHLELEEEKRREEARNERARRKNQ